MSTIDDKLNYLVENSGGGSTISPKITINELYLYDTLPNGDVHPYLDLQFQLDENYTNLHIDNFVKTGNAQNNQASINIYNQYNNSIGSISINNGSSSGPKDFDITGCTFIKMEVRLNSWSTATYGTITNLVIS